MFTNILRPYAVLIICICATSASTVETETNVNSHVPLLLSMYNLSLSTTKSPTINVRFTATPVINVSKESPAVNSFPNTKAQKVPLKRNVTENLYPQIATSIFLANYNSQQNVMQLIRNIDDRLRSLRNVEMRVPTIQEIFDSMQFTSASNVHAYRNISETDQQQILDPPDQDLQVFAKRLFKKLDKASHVVYELRDFFRKNITKILDLQQHMLTEYSEDEDIDSGFDIEIDDFDSFKSNEEKQNSINLYLNTYIQSCESGALATEQNYNKQQIQIVNYLKTEESRSHSVDHFLNENNELSLEANAFIIEKLESLKSTLTKTEANQKATSINSKIKLVGNHFKHIYFLSRSDHASDKSERYFYDLHFRYLYLSAIRRKYAFILIDIGSVMNVELMELTKNFVNNVLQQLSDKDLISIVTVAEEAHCMFLEANNSDDNANIGVYVATRERKDEIMNYINNLIVSKSLTNHSLGFERVFQILHSLENATLISTHNPITFVYITRGLLANLSDAMQVMNVIATGQQSLQKPVAIHTCAVVMDEKRIMYEKQFLTDISTQNYTKFDIKYVDWLKIRQENNLIGKICILTKMHPDKLMQASTAIFENTFDQKYLSENLEVHPPFVDPYSRDVIVSVTHAVPPFGLVGVNLYVADLIEDIINYGQQVQNINRNEFSYAFMVDRDGMTIAHPAFPRPFTQTQTPFPVDIAYLENSTNFVNIRRRILQEKSGNVKTTVFVNSNRRKELLNRSYYWRSVLGIYVLCLVSTTNPESEIKLITPNEIINSKMGMQIAATVALNIPRYGGKDTLVSQFHPPKEFEHMPIVDLLYHRLDLIPPPNGHVCRYFRQVATLDSATIFLSASAFESPFNFLHNNRMSSTETQVRTAESIMAYIKDTTGLLANPGLRPQIRHEINALYNAMKHLKKRHQDARGNMKNNIIRRYIATVSGVLQVYPGCLLSNNYDPTRRPWFRKAMQLPGKIVTTEPYLDAGGAGYIVTVAHTIFERKSNALHQLEGQQPVAIVAIDLPYTYYYKMILDSTPLCQLNNMKCLLFENEGFLIAHPSMLEASTQQKNPRRPHEHLTHKESYLANDILNHKVLVRKVACANYQNRTLQRYYVFNTSLTDILTNVVHGERTKYAITLVAGSNIFAAVLNSTCDGGAFCPCSTIDRTCLNCNRMDQMDCECPCECPMDTNGFTELTSDSDEPYSNYTQQYPYCKPPSEHFIALPQINENNLLHSCVNMNCDLFVTQQECLAVMGCEWCQQDLDGNGFAASFCTAQTTCFNGVLSSLTPYGDLDELEIIAAHGYNPDSNQSSYSALGPIGGAVVVLCIVIGLAIYCYRHSVDTGSQDQFYIDSLQEENYGLPLSRFNFDDCQAHDEPPDIYDHTSAQRNLINPANISPYHVSTGSSYRRPPNGESDHGYSTMTPHEDSSDHQCFTLAEPLLLNDNRHSKSDTMSISTSISSPTNRHNQQHNYNSSYHNQPTTSKDARYNLTSPKKYYTNVHSPARVYEQTVLPIHDNKNAPNGSHYILAPVTVHRHMETADS
ncbi:VWFA and cache domain-containing protein CG16868 [Teleopsis dalmanni]|uniref:VWFA and cache domain-containing protein CG16868 n=1 Tax=Teleopsis dalmanni TaxID=139649 RepID=UPI0018CCBABE|nr:VWFA and cache domain-containing protein CG16868 [Teleopsis dalmanni]